MYIKSWYLTTAVIFFCCTDKTNAAVYVPLCCFSSREDILKNYVICLRLYCKSELCHGKQRFTHLMISLLVTVTDCDLKNVHKINSEYA